MIQRTFKFGIGPKDHRNYEAVERTAAQVRPLLDGLLGKKDQLDNIAVDVTSPKMSRWVEALREILVTRELAHPQWARLEERTVEGKDRPAEWFVLEPRAELEHHGNTPEGVNFVKADRMKPGVHVAAFTHPPCVSEAFRALVAKQKLRGLDFVWLPDKGRTNGAMQWYLAVAEQILGRGLDHDWFDPAKLAEGAKRATWWMTAEPGWRAGVVRCKASEMKPAISLGSAAADELLTLFPRDRMETFEAFGQRRFLRAFLPDDVDFAYFWTTPDHQATPGGSMRSSRQLAVSRRAMEVLLDAKLVTPKEFEPIEILDEPPTGVAVLDRTGDRGPGPLFGGELRQRIDARERELRGAADEKPAPTRKSALPAVLARLMAARQADGANFPRGASAADLEAAAAKLKVALPRSWRDVLAASNGFTISESDAVDGADCWFEPAKKLAAAQKRALDYLKLVWEEKPAGVLYIGDTIGGDFFLLRVGAKSEAAAAADDDAQAVLVSHETGEELANWPGVAAMLAELLPAAAAPGET